MKQYFSIDQCACSKDGYFQLRLTYKDSIGKRRKAYLIISLRQQDKRINFHHEKPEINVSSMEAFATRIKKHLNAGFIKDMCALGEDLCTLTIYNFDESPSNYELWIHESKPPILEFVDISTNTSLARMTYDAQFTKAKSLDIPQHKNISRSISISNLILKEQNTELSQSEVSSEDKRSVEPAVSQQLREQRDLAHKLVRKKKLLQKSISKSEEALPTQKELLNLEKAANFLKINGHLWKKLSSENRNYSDPLVQQAQDLKLDFDASLGHNLDKIFQEKKSLERAQERQSLRLQQYREKLQKLESIIQTLRSDRVADIHSMNQWSEEFEVKISKPSQKESQKSQNSPSMGRLFLITPDDDEKSINAVSILVSRSAKEADALIKSARSNDFWFHAVKGTAAHVIVPFRKEFQMGLPSSIERIAMILAAHYSDFSNDLAAEIYCARRSVLRKKRGLSDGLWLVDRAKATMVRYTREELERILKLRQ